MVFKPLVSFLTSLGPEVPEYYLYNTGTLARVRTLEDNAAYKTLISAYDIPKKTFTTVRGVEDDLNAWIIRSKGEENLSPVLFNIYGGPGSQTVTKKWSLGFDEYLASSVGISVASVGTQESCGVSYVDRQRWNRCKRSQVSPKDLVRPHLELLFLQL